MSAVDSQGEFTNPEGGGDATIPWRQFRLQPIREGIWGDAENPYCIDRAEPMILDELPIPIIQAPLAGGPSTPGLAGVVSGAGGLGFVAAGYRTPEAMAEDIAATRALTDRPFGVNLFTLGTGPASGDVVDRYAEVLRAEAQRAGVELGRPRFDDDGFEEKLQVLRDTPVPVVSFTFGCPPRSAVASLQEAGSEVWVTVTHAGEARKAEAAGANALVLQGSEAGGHRGSFVDRNGREEYSVLTLLQLVARQTRLPLVAAGGIATGAAVAAVLTAGAAAAQIGTAFMRCPEAGTSPVHREVLGTAQPTALTRAFTGRLARGIVNRFMRDFDRDAPIAYPEVHYLTAPLRAWGRKSGDAGVVNLWAGQAHELAQDIPAGQLVAQLHAEALAAVRRAEARLAQQDRHTTVRVEGPCGLE